MKTRLEGVIILIGWLGDCSTWVQDIFTKKEQKVPKKEQMAKKKPVKRYQTAKKGAI